MRRLRAAALLLGVAATSACGVPVGGEPTTIPASDVPYGLAQPNPTSAPLPSPDPALDPSRVFLVSGEETLVPRSREVVGVTRQERLDDLLEHLADGPTRAERDAELSTALPPDAQLTVTELFAGTATIDIAGPADAPSGWATRRAVGQIVLTATSVPGVEDVLLTVAGDPVDAPLPSGPLTSEPLTAADYEEFLRPPAPPSVMTAPPSAVPAAPPS